jgi:hypothetical protein
VGDLLIETRTREPAPGQVHAQFFDQLAFAADAVQIANQQNAQQKLRIDRRSASVAVAVFQFLPYKLKNDGQPKRAWQNAGRRHDSLNHSK